MGENSDRATQMTNGMEGEMAGQDWAEVEAVKLLDAWPEFTDAKTMVSTIALALLQAEERGRKRGLDSAILACEQQDMQAQSNDVEMCIQAIRARKSKQKGDYPHA